MNIKYNHCKHFRKATKEWCPDNLELGLGDYFERSLEKIGVTKNRWNKLLKEFNSEYEGCGCNKRHKMVNWLGEKLGMPKGVGPEMTEALRSTAIPRVPIHNCASKGRCVGNGKYPESVVTAIRDTGIEPCQHCDSFEPKEM